VLPERLHGWSHGSVQSDDDHRSALPTCTA
jgi:hypothetical protein